MGCPVELMTDDLAALSAGRRGVAAPSPPPLTPADAGAIDEIAGVPTCTGQDFFNADSREFPVIEDDAAVDHNGLHLLATRGKHERRNHVMYRRRGQALFQICNKEVS